MYEPVSAPLLPRREFMLRLLRHAVLAVILLGGSLGIGILGYAVLDDLPLVDSFLDASMILGGMGPVDPLRNDAAKIFAGLYALYSGVVFLIAVGVVFAPVLHRVLHSLHAEPAEPKDDGNERVPSRGSNATEVSPE